MRNIPLPELMRQFEIDCDAPIVTEPRKFAPARLLILSCSASKASGAGLSARERYIGPLWQTLKAADPHGEAAQVAYLSARFGLGDARGELPDYNSKLTAQAADDMIKRGLSGVYPIYKFQFRTETARLRHLAKRDPLRTAAGEISSMLHAAGRPFQDIAICGGKEYVRVAQAHVAELKDIGWIADDAPVTIINDGIGLATRWPAASRSPAPVADLAGATGDGLAFGAPLPMGRGNGLPD